MLENQISTIKIIINFIWSLFLKPHYISWVEIILAENCLEITSL